MSPGLIAILARDRTNTAPAILVQLPGLLQAQALAAAAAPQPVYLNFNMELQTQSNWCWAATARSVSRFYSAASPWTQCTIAQRAFLHLQCPCANPFPCDQPWYLDQALGITNNNNGLARAILAYARIDAVLQTTRVIGARTAWAGGGAHFVVIHGCHQVGGVNYLDIDDPSIGKSTVTETVFLTAYDGSGTWTHAYFTKP